MDDVETICKSPGIIFYFNSMSKTRLVLIVCHIFCCIDKEAQLKEKEENQHPLAYAPVKFKQYIKQEPKDEEAHCQSNVSQDFIQEASRLVHVLLLYIFHHFGLFSLCRMVNLLKGAITLLLMASRQPMNHQVFLNLTVTCKTTRMVL